MTLIICTKMTRFNNQEKSESFRTLNYNNICVILKLPLGGLNQLWDIGLKMLKSWSLPLQKVNASSGNKKKFYNDVSMISMIMFVSLNILKFTPQLMWLTPPKPCPYLALHLKDDHHNSRL